ncbi:MAG: dihydroneopterin triphosphate diphosphatase [Methylophilaceae bacterium]
MIKLKKIPISTQIIVFTNQKQILLLQRKDNPNYWQSVTGSLEINEAPRDCAIRELYEETNLNAYQYNFFSLGHMNQYTIFPEWRHRYEDGVNNNTEHLFALQLPKKENIIINKEEHLSYQWLNLEDAIKKVFSWTNRKALIKFKKLYE